ncbi:MAG: DNA repair protein RecN [Thermoanaerobacteraceae bacterium]|nr:DNA repair protein RecN [Thermoanaerobacteraceae bacterium]
MLLSLSIKNFALIESLDIDFANGLNILTGETGAGKSIIIDAVNVLLGGRSDKDYIRTGADSAFIEGSFDIQSVNEELFDLLGELGLSDSDILIITREFNQNGKSVSRINGKQYPLNIIKAISNNLLEIVGQNENQSLLNVNNHIKLLDAFGKNQLKQISRRVEELCREFEEKNDKFTELHNMEREKARTIDVLEYQLKEIRSSNLHVGEDEELEEREKIVKNAKKIFDILKDSYERMYGGSYAIIDNLGIIMNGLEKIKEFKEFLEFYNTVSNSYYSIDDTAREIRNYLDTFEYNPDELTWIEERINQINELKRKYGVNIKDILDYKEKIENDLKKLKSNTEELKNLENEIREIQKQYLESAINLSESRKKVAQELEKRIKDELKELNMGNCKFKVEINSNMNTISINGIDKVEFLISTNPGEPLKPLAKVASGGEMSRILLALKVVFADADKINTLIFDEIDSGISGRAGQAVAMKLMVLSRKHQIICITHLPQIASMADEHFRIEKEVVKDSTYTILRKLNENERIREISRMISGSNITDASIKNSQEMLNIAQSLKESVLLK